MKTIYLDYNATTPLDPRALEKMLPYFQEKFGNSSSSSHSYGWDAETAATQARTQVAQLLGAKAHEIAFTSGSTEANNWVISELARMFRIQNQKAHFITSQIEHASVLAPMKRAEEDGIEVTYLPVNKQGQVEISEFKKTLRPETRLVSLIAANNEIGTLNPLTEIGRLCRENKTYFHTDATQWIGKLPFDVDALNVDLVSLSAHKFYGPKGVGALYIRSQNPKVDLSPALIGGGQEAGRRSGTLNIPGIVGMGEAAALAQQLMADDSARQQKLKELIVSRLEKEDIPFRINGMLTSSLPNTLNLTFLDPKATLLSARLGRLAVSSSSACHSAAGKTSPVLKALGVTSEEATATLRISLGRGTTQECIEEALEILVNTLNHMGNKTSQISL